MSGLANYVSGSLDLADELLASLEEADIELLREHLSERPVMYWIKWRIEHHVLICDFVESTPGNRKKLKRFQQDRLPLTMAGIQLCQEAAALICVITTPPLVAGGAYRKMAALAGDSYNRLLEKDVPYWSFSKGPSPFSDDPANENELA